MPNKQSKPIRNFLHPKSNRYQHASLQVQQFRILDIAHHITDPKFKDPKLANSALSLHLRHHRAHIRLILVSTSLVDTFHVPLFLPNAPI